MTSHRFQARADLFGEHELGVDGSRIELVALTLTDAGPSAAPDGTEHEQPDVICPLRAGEARALAGRLLELADHADRRQAPSR